MCDGVIRLSSLNFDKSVAKEQAEAQRHKNNERVQSILHLFLQGRVDAVTLDHLAEAFHFLPVEHGHIFLLPDRKETQLAHRHVINLEVVLQEEDAKDKIPCVTLVLPELYDALMLTI